MKAISKIHNYRHSTLNQVTLISHIYNEEYLLPFWLEHHRSIFKHGIIIDYNSTDRSLDIIREYCPNWRIIQSENKMFEAASVDNEIMKIESTIPGYKITLNTTEFFIFNLPHGLSTSLNCFSIPVINAISSKENIYPNTLREFFSGIEKISTTTGAISRGQLRFLHNHTHGEYTTGRHRTHLNISNENLGAIILWVGMYPWNTKTIQRKMQIKTRIPESDKVIGYGTQHQLSEMELYIVKTQMLSSAIDIGDLPIEFKQPILSIQQL